MLRAQFRFSRSFSKSTPMLIHHQDMLNNCCFIKLERNKVLGIRVRVIRVPGTAELRKGCLTVSTVEVRADVSVAKPIRRIQPHITNEEDALFIFRGGVNCVMPS